MNKNHTLQSNIFKGHQGSIYTLEQMNQGHFLSAAGDGNIVRWNIHDPSSGLLISKIESGVFCLKYIKDKNLLIAGSGKGNIHFLDLNKQSEIKNIQAHSSFVFALAVSDNQNSIFSVSADGHLFKIGLDDYTVVNSKKIASHKLRDICVLPDQNKIIVAEADGCISLIDTENLNVLDRFQAHESGFSVYTLCLSEQSGLLYSGARDAHINIYAQNNFTIQDRIPAHNYAIYKLLFNPSGNYLASASRDKHVKIWDPSSMKVIERINHAQHQGHINSVNTLLWLDDENLLSAGDDRAILHWNLKTLFTDLRK
ncbi:MAG TPA: WD40 repeat domain-containing protein [Bacteroidia bacterium]|nr:WD40 repeat domain-containing protein [Bacteroidia bacterium]HNT79104.1 WD40 repeat domain-containing protein [Bacteroidia bacterium]